MQENSNWKLLFSSRNIIDIKLKQKILENNNIKCHFLNKMDSTFTSISFAGEMIELYVLKKDFQKAIELIKNTTKKESFLTKYKKSKLLNISSSIILFFICFLLCIKGDFLIGSVIFVFGIILILNY